MNDREKFTPPETPYKRIQRLYPEGNWTDAAAISLTNGDEIKQWIKEEISETLRKIPDKRYAALQHTPESLLESIRRVIDGPIIKTPEQKAMWEKALEEAVAESDYYSD
ncbi:MAG: hypothetical protein WC687_05070 [Patescibacteria group bacterium]|jgi:hypothetical protein